MGSCLSSASNSNSDAKSPKAKAGTVNSKKNGDEGDSLVDNRPVLRQQPRRRSVEGHLAPVPQREGPIDPRKQSVSATQSQVDFFRILDEKIEMGGEGGDDSGDRPASVADQADDQSSQGTPESAAGGADAAASTEEKLSVTDQQVQSQTASGVGSPTADRSNLTNETASPGNVTAGRVTDSAAGNVASVDNDQTGQMESLAKDEKE